MIPKSFWSFVESLDTKTMERGWKSAMVSVPGAASFQDEFKKMIQLLKKMKL